MKWKSGISNNDMTFSTTFSRVNSTVQCLIEIHDCRKSVELDNAVINVTTDCSLLDIAYKHFDRDVSGQRSLFATKVFTRIKFLLPW